MLNKIELNIRHRLADIIEVAFKEELSSIENYLSPNINKNEKLEIILLNHLVNFCNLNSINVFFISGPDKHQLSLKNIEPYLYKNMSLEDIMKDNEFMSKFFRHDKDLLDYAYDKRMGLLWGNCITTNGCNLISAWFKSKYLNIDNKGERKSIPAILQEDNEKKDIYIFGSCFTFGLFADDNRTFPSFLQELLNSIPNNNSQVHNMGIKGQNHVLNDLLFALNTEFKTGDTIIFVEKYNKLLNNEIKKLTGKLPYNFTRFLNSQSIGSNNFLNSGFHCNHIIYKFFAKYIFSLLFEQCPTSNILDKSKKISFLKQSNKLKTINSNLLIEKIFLNDLNSNLDKFKHKSNFKNKIVGSIVTAANPLTLGHARLISKMAQECDICYIFVIEDSDFYFPFKSRYKMVESFLKAQPNCIAIPTGDFFGADFLFPEYHEKSNYIKRKINNPVLDTVVFTDFICPKLGINRRYLGTEESDPVTQQFNAYLLSILPQKGIEVIVVPRYKVDNVIPYSGSKVRDLIKNGCSEEDLIKYLPRTTIQVLYEHNYL